MRWKWAGQVIDLRRGDTAGSAGRGPWMSVAFAALGLFAIASFIELCVVVVMASGPHDVPFDVIWTDRRGAVVGMVYDPGSPVRPGDVFEAVDGQPVTADRGNAVFRSLLEGRRAFDATLVRTARGDSLTGSEPFRYQARIELVRYPWWESFAGAVWAAAMIVIAAIGMLAIRAPGVDRSKTPFVLLCLITSAGQLAGLWFVAREWRHPFIEGWDALSGLGGTLLGVFLILWCFVFGLALRRFLTSLAPGSDPRRSIRHWTRTIGRLALASIGIGLVIAVLRDMRHPGFDLARFAVRTAFLTVLVLPFAAVFLLMARLPISVFRRAGEIRRNGGEAAQRAETVLQGARAGAVLIGVVALIVLGWGIVSEPAMAARLGGLRAGRLGLLLSSMLELVGTTAILLPFLGVFLAVTRAGLWEADAILKKVTAWSGLSVLFVFSWAAIEQLVELVVGGGVGELGSGLVAGALVASLRGPASDRITRAVFPASRNLRRSLEELSLRIGAGPSDHDTLGRDLMRAIGADALAIVALDGDTRARLVWHRGPTPPVSLVAAAVLPALREAPDVIVTTQESAFLAVRLGEASAVRGIVLIDPTRGTRSYDREERRLLAMTLNLIGIRLSARSWVAA